jgi:glycerol-3-phosphate dehydrogenase
LWLGADQRTRNAVEPVYSMSDKLYDVLVIGGGINGAGIAAEAAARGLSVILAEAEDLAGATSSASSKLIHGGLRYLEQYEFRLVREALTEREVLLAKAPHLIHPLRFVLPQVPHMRSALLMRAGLFLYDHLSRRRSLGSSRAVDLTTDPSGRPLVPALKRGWSYWDCAVDDARLVVANAVAAREAGADIRTRTPVTRLATESGLWRATLGNGGGECRARFVVNATGPWVAETALHDIVERQSKPIGVRLVRGSHITVPRIAGADDAYTFQNDDGRVVFAIPYEDHFTLIGTTDEPMSGDPRSAQASGEEVDYLLNVMKHYFRTPLKRSDIVWSFAGVRPLEDDGSENASELSRDYRFVLDRDNGPPILHIIGGKVTTYRRLALGALKHMEEDFPHMRASESESSKLPGGDLGGQTFDSWFAEFARVHRNFEREFLLRLARRHGSRSASILDGAKTSRDLGEDFGGGLTERELAYLKSEEWAQSAEDVMWRRTKAGLHIAPGERTRAAERIDSWLQRPTNR